LYAKNVPGPNRDPAVGAAIERAKTFERRRCGHLMDEDPLTEKECMLSVVDPKGKGENKFRYVVVTQDDELVCSSLSLPKYGLSGLTVGYRGLGYGRWCRRRSCMCGGVSW
jgi:hypothetical protein